MSFFTFLLAHGIIRAFFEFAAALLLYGVYSQLMGGYELITIRYDESQERFRDRVRVYFATRKALAVMAILFVFLMGYCVASNLVRGLGVSAGLYVLDYLRWAGVFFALAVLLPKRCFRPPAECRARKSIEDVLTGILGFLHYNIGEAEAERVAASICNVLLSGHLDEAMIEKVLESAGNTDGSLVARGKEYAKMYFAAYSDCLYKGDETLAWTPSEEERECHAILKEAISKSLNPQPSKGGFSDGGI